MKPYQIIGHAFVTLKVRAETPAAALAAFRKWQQRWGERKIDKGVTLLAVGDKPEVFGEDGKRVAVGK